jgi:type I restriction enzyme R subunit
MRDHSLFQAICRVNRLDGDDKDYGFIIDYKDLFKSIERAVGDYTTEAFDNFDHEDGAGLITDRAEKASEDFDTAREAWFALLEPVEPPKGDDEVYAYFSTLDGVTDPVPSEEKARRRQTLYRLAGAFARAFAGIAEDPTSSGVTESEIYLYRKEVEDALNLRDAIRLHSGDAIDLKLYEPAMRALIDTFIQADDSKTISTLDDVSLIDLIDGAPSSIEDGLPAALGRNRDNVAEAIANNVRRLIIEETPVNPRFYETMSGLLTDLVKKRRDDAIDYAAYLARIAEMIRQIKAGHGMSYPPSIASSGPKALFDNLDKDEKLTLAVDKAIRDTAQAGWRGNRMKTCMVMRCLVEVLGSDDEADRILEIVRAHDEY